jgi:hypothetical protein
MLLVRMWVQIHLQGTLIHFFQSRVPSNSERRRWKAEKRGDGKMKHRVLRKPGPIEFSKSVPIKFREEVMESREEEMES